MSTGGFVKIVDRRLWAERWGRFFWS